MNNLNHSVLSECRNQFYEKIKFLHVLNNENLFSISVEIGFLVENRVRDAEGATEGSRAKHRSEAKPKAARPKQRQKSFIIFFEERLIDNKNLAHFLAPKSL